MRALMLNDNRAHPNWGAQATPFALDAVLSSGIPAYEPTWMSWDWLRSQHRVLRPPLPDWTFEPERLRRGRWILSRLSRPLETFPRVADDFDHFADVWMAGRGGPMATLFLHELNRAEVLVYNGENSLYRNTREGIRALFLLWLSKTRLGKPSCIVNHTAHPTGVMARMNAMMRKVYPILDLVAVRESASYHLLHRLGIENAELIPDAVFWFEEEADAGRRVDEWLTARGLAGGGYLCMSASGLPVSRPQGEWDGAYSRLVRLVRERTGRPAVLVARDPYCQFLADVARRTGSEYFGPEHHFSDLWPLLRRAAALVTGHFHYAIIAAIVGCPFVPMSGNNHKTAGLCEMLRWEPREPFDITDLATCTGAIVDRVEGLLAERLAHSAHLAQRARELRAEVATLSRRIEQAARTPGRGAA